MSVSNGYPVLDIAVTVSDASATKYRIMQGDGTDTTNSSIVVKAATASTTRPVGVLQSATTTADEVATMRVSGVALIDVDGSNNAIDIGDVIMATTGGQGVLATATDATARYGVGIALAPSAADGDEIPVLLNIGGAEHIK